MHIIAIAIALFASRVAHANAGIPVVDFGWPFMLFNLIFVVAIEVYVLRRLRQELDLKAALHRVFVANVITTLIGYPLVAGLQLLAPLGGINIGWLLPFENLETQTFYIGTMMLFTLIPCYFLSVWVEGKYLRKKLSDKITWKSVYLIHLASYAFLIAQVYSNFPVRLLDYAVNLMLPTLEAFERLLAL